ncbi:RING-H2 finger protein ATL54-like [Rhodamnia argentea]|uniref:RING-H2 finger protein ATL54-like n=1 Tax=Rhodamnia argentea TaxID=178133 RepID=A0A8B8QL62_9MYRT|nr:RING-H2 finger protein ATL54-like [Rhodamnia argentea]
MPLSATPSPLPPPPPLPRFSHSSLFSTLLACGIVVVYLIAVGYLFCRGWCFDGVKRALFYRGIEWRRGDVGKFDIRECAICLECFEEGEEPCVLETCNHGYHEGCIEEWLSRNQHCPLCRGSVRAGQMACVTPSSGP